MEIQTHLVEIRQPQRPTKSVAQFAQQIWLEKLLCLSSDWPSFTLITPNDDNAKPRMPTQRQITLWSKAQELPLVYGVSRGNVH